MIESGYGAGKGVLGFLAVLGWLSAFLGVGAGVLVYVDGGLWDALMIAAPAVLSGMVLVALAEIGQAIIANAQASVAMLSELREIRKARPSGQPVLSAPALAPASGPRLRVGASQSLAKVYRDVSIMRAGDGFAVDGAPFASIAEAEHYIDRNSGGGS